MASYFDSPERDEWLRRMEARAAPVSPQQAIAFAPPAPPQDQNRSLGQWVGDTALSVGRGLASTGAAAAGLAGLLPVVNLAADPLSQGLSEFSDYLGQQQSPVAQRARAEMAQAWENDDWKAALGAAFTNPSNVVDLAAQMVQFVGAVRGAQALPWMQRTFANAFVRAGVAEGALSAGALSNQI